MAHHMVSAIDFNLNRLHLQFDWGCLRSRLQAA